ncbi:MAG: hypothetical protein LCH56_11995 [Proteobacteria bacterium]|nr:hypothetical protein [Pseudomonadota bacterium]
MGRAHRVIAMHEPRVREELTQSLLGAALNAVVDLEALIRCWAARALEPLPAKP